MNLRSQCIAGTLLVTLTACSPVPLTSDMLNSYENACKDHGGIVMVDPEDWIWTARVICGNGTIFRFQGDKALIKTFRFSQEN